MNKSVLANIFLPIAFLIAFGACDTKEPQTVDGLKPVYINKNSIYNVYSGSPIPVINPGKIYLYGDLVFINERGRGVHVINNANPHNPIKTHFISIPGNYDIAIRNNMLYADNAGDLITLNIGNLDNINVVSRINKVYKSHNQLYPDAYIGYFECADTTLGYVIAWEKARLTEPKCYR